MVLDSAGRKVVDKNKLKPDEVEVYGAIWKKTDTMLAIELYNYRNNIQPVQGGLGAEQHFRNAFKIMWPNFQWHDWMELMMTAWCREEVTILLGHTRASKTFGTAPIVYLDWMADPFNTMTSLSTVTFSGLRARMWGDLMRCVNTASEKCPFIVRNNNNEMRIYQNDENGKPDLKSMIEGFAISKTKDSAEKIQGMHANRRRWILDEAEGVAQAIFDAEANPMSSDNYKSFKLANPFDKHSAFGLLYEPEGGWSSIDDSDLVWRSKKGYRVLHFDGLQCHNMVHFNALGDTPEYKAKEYPWMITPKYVEKVIERHGENSVQYWKFVRGFPPPDGTVSRAFNSIVIERMKINIEFDFAPVQMATLDPAFDHDDCVLHLLEYGQNRQNKVSVMGKKSHVIKTKVGRGEDPKDYQIAYQIMDICNANGIHPSNFIMDKTSNARGVFAILYKEWSKEIHGCDFNGYATERPIKADDPDKACDLFLKFVDELWFRLAAWGAEGLIGGLHNLDDKTEFDLGGRLYVLTNDKPEKQTLETKKEYTARIGRSPDYGDSMCLATELLALKGIHIGGTMSFNDLKTNKHGESRRKRANRLSRRYRPENSFPPENI